MQRLHLASDNLNQCAGVVLDAVPDVFRFIRLTATRHRAKGLGVQQFRTLAYLHRHPGDSMSFLADYLGLSLAATSRLIDSMVRKKLVRRVVVPDNRRKVRLTHTQRGRQLFGSVVRFTEAELKDHLKDLSSQRRATIIDALEDLSAIFTIGEGKS